MNRILIFLMRFSPYYGFDNFFNPGQRSFPVQRTGLYGFFRRLEWRVEFERPPVQRFVGLSVIALESHVWYRLVGRKPTLILRHRSRDRRVQHDRLTLGIGPLKDVPGFFHPICFDRFDLGRGVFVEGAHGFRAIKSHQQQLHVIVFDLSV